MHHNPMLPVTRRLLLSVLVTGTALLGCDPPTETDGNSDQGHFQIEPECDLAKGADLEISVGDFEPSAAPVSGINLTDPTVEDGDIAKIASYDSEGTLELTGLKSGQTVVKFTADADGESIDDSFEVKVVDVTKLTFLPCASDAAYVRGERVDLPYQFNASASKDVLGLRYYPFAISPSSALTLDEAGSTTESFSLMVNSGASDAVVLRSSLAGDDTTLNLAIVDESEFDAAVPFDSSTTTRGSTLQVDLRPLVNGRTVCSNVRRVLRSLYPGVCSIVGATDGELDTTELTAQISFDMAGVCELYLDFPGADEFFLGSIVVADPPSSGSSSSGGSDWDWD